MRQRFTEHGPEGTGQSDRPAGSENPAQLRWLTGQARRLGYRDVDALLRAAPERLERLARLWRRRHPVARSARGATRQS